jgi:hypothetical protein
MMVIAKTSNKLIRIRGFRVDYLGHAQRESHIPSLPANNIPNSTLRFSHVPEKTGDQMHMSMQHGLASSRADVHANVKAVRMVLCNQPRSHTEKQFKNGAKFAGRQLKEV